MNIYALELDSSKYYIGKTSSDVSTRFEEHKTENDSEWSSTYKPVKIIEQYQSNNQFEKDTLTKKYTMKYDIDNVHGGDHVFDSALQQRPTLPFDVMNIIFESLTNKEIIRTCELNKSLCSTISWSKCFTIYVSVPTKRC